MTLVRNQRVIYLDDAVGFVVGPSVDVLADADVAEISAVGWEVESLGGAAEVLVPEDSRHPQASLPHALPAYGSARWMMTRDEIVTTLSKCAASIDLDSARLTPFAVIDACRVRGAAAVPLADPPWKPDSPTDEPSRRPALDDLEPYERKVSSQNGEDGVIAAIFDVIGVTNQHFVEFGCGPAVECNGAYLLAQGWTGLLMDPFHESENPLAEIKPEFVTAENIQALLEKYQVPEQFDLVSIDVDGNDFWIWQRLTSRPRVVVIEYNAHVSPILARTIRYDPSFRWSHTDYEGASLRALYELGRRKGYTLMYCERHGVNAFFVADECLPDGFEPGKIESIYRPPNYLGQGFAFPHDPTQTMVDPFDRDDANH